MGHIYTEKIYIVYLKFKYNWLSCILFGQSYLWVNGGGSRGRGDEASDLPDFRCALDSVWAQSQVGDRLRVHGCCDHSLSLSSAGPGAAPGLDQPVLPFRGTSDCTAFLPHSLGTLG